jgi:hypothetical protein
VRRRFLLLGAVLVAAIAVNAVQFPAVEAAAGHGRDAVAPGETADLAAIAYRECDWCRDRYALHIALAAVAPGSRVIVAPSDPYLLPSPYDRAEDAAEEITVRLLTFGGAREVDWLDGDGWARDPEAPRLVAGVDPVPFITASGPGGQKGAPWAIAVDPDRRVPDLPANPDHFVGHALAHGEHVDSTGQAGEFVLVRWYSPRYGYCYATGFCYSYQDLLLETSLLPAHLRGSL